MARKLAVATTLITLSLAVPAGASADTIDVPAKPPMATSAGLLGGVNGLLGGTVGTILDTGGDLIGSVDPTGGVLTDAAGTVIGTVDATTGQIFDVTGDLLATVDAATGLVLDPSGNILGAILPSGQTPSGSNGTTGSPGSPQTPTQQNDRGTAGSAGAFALALSGSRSQRLSTVARRGVTARSACSTACGVLAAITVDGRTAKRLGLGNGVRPVVIGMTAAGSQGALPIRLTSRARRALSRSLPTRRTRRSVRSKRIRAQRRYRAAHSGSAKRSARRSYVRYRRTERRFISSGRVKFVVAAVAVDRFGRTSTTRRLSLIVKR